VTAACIITYEDAQFIAATLFSIAPHVDRIIVIDGAYRNFPHDVHLSVDGSMEIADTVLKRCFPHVEAVFISTSEPWTSEAEKRNAYLNRLRDGEWFIVLDGDEMLVGDVKAGLKEIQASGKDAGRIPVYELRESMSIIKHVNNIPRVIRFNPTMRYVKHHSNLIDERGPVNFMAGRAHYTEKFGILHFSHLRLPERKRRKEIYGVYQREAGE